MYAYAKDEEAASEIEDNSGFHIAVVASAIIGGQVEVIVILPKVLQKGQ